MLLHLPAHGLGRCHPRDAGRHKKERRRRIEYLHAVPIAVLLRQITPRRASWWSYPSSVWSQLPCCRSYKTPRTCSAHPLRGGSVAWALFLKRSTEARLQIPSAPYIASPAMTRPWSRSGRTRRPFRGGHRCRGCTRPPWPAWRHPRAPAPA